MPKQAMKEAGEPQPVAPATTCDLKAGSSKTLGKTKGWKKWKRRLSRVFKGKKKGKTTGGSGGDGNAGAPRLSDEYSPTASEQEDDHGRKAGDERYYRRPERSLSRSYGSEGEEFWDEEEEEARGYEPHNDDDDHRRGHGGRGEEEGVEGSQVYEEYEEEEVVEYNGDDIEDRGGEETESQYEDDCAGLVEEGEEPQHDDTRGYAEQEGDDGEGYDQSDAVQVEYEHHSHEEYVDEEEDGEASEEYDEEDVDVATSENALVASVEVDGVEEGEGQDDEAEDTAGMHANQPSIVGMASLQLDLSSLDEPRGSASVSLSSVEQPAASVPTDHGETEVVQEARTGEEEMEEEEKEMEDDEAEAGLSLAPVLSPILEDSAEAASECPDTVVPSTSSIQPDSMPSSPSIPPDGTASSSFTSNIYEIIEWSKSHDTITSTVKYQLLETCVAQHKPDLAQLLARKIDREHRVTRRRPSSSMSSTAQQQAIDALLLIAA